MFQYAILVLKIEVIVWWSEQSTTWEKIKIFSTYNFLKADSKNWRYSHCSEYINFLTLLNEIKWRKNFKTNILPVCNSYAPLFRSSYNWVTKRKQILFQNYSQFANANEKHYRIQILRHSKKLLHYYLKDEKSSKRSKVTGFIYIAWFIWGLMWNSVVT